MKPRPRKKTELEIQNKIWKQKLKESGFVDIENSDGSLNIGVPRSRHYQDAELRDITESYYRMAEVFLNEHEFESEFERAVWALHAEGETIRAIASKLSATLIETHKDRVWHAIKKLETIMKARYLAP